MTRIPIPTLRNAASSPARRRATLEANDSPPFGLSMQLTQSNGQPSEKMKLWLEPNQELNSSLPHVSLLDAALT
jgi:hypothetical protein